MLSKSPFDANLTQLIFNESKNALTKPIVRAFLLEIGCHSSTSNSSIYSSAVRCVSAQILTSFSVIGIMSWLPRIPSPYDFPYLLILEAVIGLVTAFDIKADVLVSLALIASVCIGEDFAAGVGGHHRYPGPGCRSLLPEGREKRPGIQKDLHSGQRRRCRDRRGSDYESLHRQLPEWRLLSAGCDHPRPHRPHGAGRPPRRAGAARRAGHPRRKRRHRAPFTEYHADLSAAGARVSVRIQWSEYDVTYDAPTA